MDPDLSNSKPMITANFRSNNDFDFIPKEELSAMLDLLIELDGEYMRELREEDFYDELIVFDRLSRALDYAFPKYLAYNCRFVDDYMDYMEHYLSETDGIEWV